MPKSSGRNPGGSAAAAAASTGPAPAKSTAVKSGLIAPTSVATNSRSSASLTPTSLHSASFAPPSIGWTHIAAIGAIIVASAAILFALGRLPICKCGTIKLWHGVVQSAENSQHIADWYTFSHVLHGLLFYMGLRWIWPSWPLGLVAVAATFIEGAWEVLENTPIIIDRYRAATISLDYYGDSIVNSVADIVAMLFGFWLAMRLPVGVSVALYLVIEIMLAVVIRDNLLLNIIMLIWPIAAIKQWQGGG